MLINRPFRRRFGTQMPFGIGRLNQIIPMADDCLSLMVPNDYMGTYNSGPFIKARPWDVAKQRHVPDLRGSSPFMHGSTGPGGYCAVFDATDQAIILNDPDVEFIDNGDLIPDDQVTIILIRRKTDTTLRASNMFGHGTGVASGACNGVLPWSDNVCSFCFGGYTGSNIITASGLTWDTNVEKWMFTAGPMGLSMWRNNIRVAFSSTVVTRTPQSKRFHINFGDVGTGAGDLQEVYLFGVFDSDWQLSEEKLRQFFELPYDLLAAWEPFYTMAAGGALFIPPTEPIEPPGDDLIIDRNPGGSLPGACA